MSKLFKTYVSVALLMGLLFTNTAFAAVSNGSAGGGTIVAPTVLLRMAGIVTQASDTTGYIFTSEKSVVYSLTGNTSGLEKYLGKKIMVEGYIVNANSDILLPNTTMYVVRYSPITWPTPFPSITPKPTLSPIPTRTPAPPINMKLMGVITLSDNATYKYALTTDGNLKCLLTGKIDGIDQYIDKKVIVVGYMQPILTATGTTSAIINNRVFVVTEFYPFISPTPTPTRSPLPSPSPKPTRTPAPPINMKLMGVITLSDNATYKYALTTDGYVKCLLTGKTDGIDQYIDKKVIVVGYMQPMVAAIGTTSAIINNRVFVVTEFYPVISPSPTPTKPPLPSPSPKPTPSPIPPVNMKIMGVLTLSDNATYKYALTTDRNVKYLLTGKTDGIDQYIDKRVIVVGYMQPMITATGTTSAIINNRVFVVTEFYPVISPSPTPTKPPLPSPSPKPTPSPIPPINMKLMGVITLSDNATYKCALTTDRNVKYLLTGKTDGIDQYIDKRVIVVGYMQPMITATGTTSAIINNRVFVVVKYYPVPLTKSAPMEIQRTLKN